MTIDFESKPGNGDGDKYIKTKIKIYAGSTITNSRNKKNTQTKSTIQVFINNNAIFCY